LNQSIARPVGFRCAATEVPEAIERLLKKFLSDGTPNENLRRFFARHSDAELRNFLAGELVEAVERDVPEGRVPSGVEG
jgi:sulfite reductase (ferredoxin)